MKSALALLAATFMLGAVTAYFGFIAPDADLDLCLSLALACFVIPLIAQELLHHDPPQS